ncbi:MAG: aminoacyl-histidine dipeptidase [Ignavibacteriae bacterium]|nr:aminoacyl-histidine dipeptidase [Ignavibacteriota bacterium]
MSTAIEGLQPALVWKYFAEIARIPRCSKHEKAIGEYVIDTAKQLGLVAKQDSYGSIVVKKSASPGYDHVRSVCLQGHLDMVCEKNKEKEHDFSKDPIEIVRKGDVLMANGTTLGADNGIAVATNLAIMEDKSIEHGPLEFLFTVDEETGLTGASNLSSDFLESRTLLNLDSEEEGALYVGCSGGRDTIGTWRVEFENAPTNTVATKLIVRGLRGGHSGLEIDKGRGNAIKILNRVLIQLSALGSQLSIIEGGNKRNAIPRECEALLFIPNKKLSEAKSSVATSHTTIKLEFATVDPDLSITLEEVQGSKKGKVMKKKQQDTIIKTILALPHGVLKTSADIPGLVETSTNVAVINTTKKAVVLATSQRSSVASELDEAVQSVSSIFGLGGATVENSDGYPGWKPNLDSKILRIAKETYKSLFGKEPAIKAIHAGLECGIIGEKIPGMDMVSFGPTLEGVHSPDEKIYIDTVGRFWRFLLAILNNVN